MKLYTHLDPIALHLNTLPAPPAMQPGCVGHASLSLAPLGRGFIE